MDVNLFICALCAFILFSIFQLGFVATPLRLADPDDAQSARYASMPLGASICGIFATMPLSFVCLRALAHLLKGDGPILTGVIPFMFAVILMIFALFTETLVFRAILVHLQMNRLAIFILSKPGEYRNLKKVYEPKDE